MKTNTLKPFLSGMVAVAGLLSISMFSLALAQVEPPIMEETPAPIIVDISSDGTALVRGTVTAVGTNTITVESWGGLWTVRMADDSAIAAEGTTTAATATSNTLEGIAAGDFVGAEGIVSGDEQFTLDASFVRNWTTDPIPGAFDDANTQAADATSTTSE